MKSAVCRKIPYAQEQGIVFADQGIFSTRIGNAIKDCSRGDEVVIARCARIVEIDPLYADITVRQWQTCTGKCAIHGTSRIAFEEASLHIPRCISSSFENSRLQSDCILIFERLRLRISFRS